MREQLLRLWERLSWTWAPRSEREAGEAIVRNLWPHWFPVKVARCSMSWNYSLYFGVASVVLFFILTVTGVLLMLFYVPATKQAYGDMKDLEFAVSFGWWLHTSIDGPRTRWCLWSISIWRACSSPALTAASDTLTPDLRYGSGLAI